MSDTYKDDGDHPLFFGVLAWGTMTCVDTVTVKGTMNKISCFDDYG